MVWRDEKVDMFVRAIEWPSEMQCSRTITRACKNTVSSLNHLRAATMQLEEDFVKANQEWVKELEIMVATKVPAMSKSPAISCDQPACLPCIVAVLAPTPNNRPGHVADWRWLMRHFVCAAPGEGRDPGPELVRVPVPQPGVSAAEAAGRRLDLMELPTLLRLYTSVQQL